MLRIIHQVVRCCWWPALCDDITTTTATRLGARFHRQTLSLTRPWSEQNPEQLLTLFKATKPVTRTQPYLGEGGGAWYNYSAVSGFLYSLFWHRSPSGKQSFPVPSWGSRPQSLGNSSSRPVDWGDFVPSSTNLPPPNRFVTGEKRFLMALKNWAFAAAMIAADRMILRSLMVWLW